MVHNNNNKQRAFVCSAAKNYSGFVITCNSVYLGVIISRENKIHVILDSFVNSDKEIVSTAIENY